MHVLMSENIRTHSKEGMLNHTCTIFGSTATREEISEVIEIYHKARGIKRMFMEVNKDCRMTEESVVNFTDTKYYMEQIANVYGFTEDRCAEIAELMKDIQ
jgi:hypothetical protein